MKKILFIAYYFPPAGGSAVQRCFKFAKYLPEYGFEPIVLTAREKDYALKDPSLLNEIPAGMRIVRVPAPDPYGLYAGGEKKSVDITALSAEKSTWRRRFQTFAVWIRAAFFIPDARIGWLPFAVFKGLQIIRREKVQLIFTSSPPFTTALIGRILSFRTRIPWVSDYRDPWTQAYFYFKRPRISRWIEHRLEKSLLRKPHQLLSINPYILNDMALKHRLDDVQFHVIPNGFDSEDFKQLHPVRHDRFTITYTGTLNAKMHPACFLKAVQQLLHQNPEAASQLHLKFIGRMGPEAAALLEQPEIRRMVIRIDHLPHTECLNHMAGSDLLLLIIPQTGRPELIVTGKIFEYIKSGVPILALAPEGEAAGIIRETRTGFVVNPEDINRLTRILQHCFQQWRQHRPLLNEPPDQNKIDTFDRRKQTGLLAEIFRPYASPV